MMGLHVIGMDMTSKSIYFSLFIVRCDFWFEGFLCPLSADNVHKLNKW